MSSRWTFWTWLKRLASGQPHFVIGGSDPYLLRWYLTPRNRWFNIYLHKFLRDDEDRALHDHPWRSLSIVLAGGYHEVTNAGERWFGPGSVILRHPEYRHRVVVSKSGRPAWSLFITGPKVREWGFWCPKGFVPWQKFVALNDQGSVGAGCDGETKGAPNA